MKLEWKKHQSGAVVSASAGDYRIQADGSRLIASYRLAPFIPLGNNHESVKVAMQVCQDHFDSFVLDEIKEG